jgi:hypothetical protein
VQNGDVPDPQSFDLVLDQQHATLQFRDSEIVSRWMRYCVGDLVFEGLMLPLKFRKMRLDGHVQLLPRKFSKHP